MCYYVVSCCVVFRFLSVTRVTVCAFFFFKQKTAYEMRISDWSSDVCSSDLRRGQGAVRRWLQRPAITRAPPGQHATVAIDDDFLVAGDVGESMDRPAVRETDLQVDRLVAGKPGMQVGLGMLLTNSHIQVRHQLARTRTIPAHAGTDAVTVAAAATYAHLHPAVALGVDRVSPKAAVARELGLDDVQPSVVVGVGAVRARLGRPPPVTAAPGCRTETGGSGQNGKTT